MEAAEHALLPHVVENAPALQEDPPPAEPVRKRAGKQSGFEALTAELKPKMQPEPFSVRLPPWLRLEVVARIKAMQGKGVKVTQDMVVRNALMQYFGLEEPE